MLNLSINLSMRRFVWVFVVAGLLVFPAPFAWSQIPDQIPDEPPAQPDAAQPETPVETAPPPAPDR